MQGSHMNNPIIRMLVAQVKKDVSKKETEKIGKHVLDILNSFSDTTGKKPGRKSKLTIFK